MTVQHVQTKREIEQVLATAGVHPRKRFGQHFLIDGNLMRRVARVAGLTSADLALEVGSGTGGLTDLLAADAGQVVCIEIDTPLFDILCDRFSDASHVQIIHGDCLESKHRIRGDVAQRIRDFDLRAGGAVKLVANLPYQVATPLVLNLLVGFPQVRRLVFTVQAEVGHRLIAKPGGKDFGPLAIVSQLVCRVEILSRIGPQAFWPRPAVDSVLVRMDRRDVIPIEVCKLESFALFVRSVFEHRRKTIKSALGYVVTGERRDAVCQELDSQRRPESFGVEEWLRIYKIAGAEEERIV